VLPDLSRFVLPSEYDVTLPQLEDDGSISLENIGVVRDLRAGSVYDKTFELAAKQGGKVRGTGFRHTTMVSFAGELIARGHYDDLLDQMYNLNELFEDPLDSAEIEKIANGTLRRDRKSNPAKYDWEGKPLSSKGRDLPIGKLLRDEEAKPKKKFLIRLDQNVEESSADRCIAHPLIHRPKCIQVHGHSGSGKSLVLFHLLHNIAAGHDWGPFKVLNKARVLYVDYDMGVAQLQSRSREAQKMYGLADMAIVHASSTDTGLQLSQTKGQEELLEILNSEKPDILVLDSMREAWPGLDESQSWAWAPVNQMLKYLRDVLGITVIFVHHSNKPGERTLGREAGSTAQLNVLDMQLHVIQVIGLDTTETILDPDEAASKEAELSQKAFAKGLLRDDYSYTKVVQMAAARGCRVKLVIAIEYGKNRDAVGDTGRKLIGFCEDPKSGQQIVVSEQGGLQKAFDLKGNTTLDRISAECGIPIAELRRHLL
jgi:KaiC/GvpD/RAD55 family RecA-like ATPase